jgi:hypothetical protein
MDFGQLIEHIGIQHCSQKIVRNELLQPRAVQAKHQLLLSGRR